MPTEPQRYVLIAWPPSREQIARALAKSSIFKHCVRAKEVPCSQLCEYAKQADAVLALKPEPPQEKPDEDVQFAHTPRYRRLKARREP